MNRAFRVLVLPLLMTVLFGCANLVSPVNPYITQSQCVSDEECVKAPLTKGLSELERSQCVTHEECLKAANLPNPPKPDHTFVIEEKEFNDMVKARSHIRGYTPLSNMKYNIYLDICVGKALAALSPSSRVLIGVTPKDSDIYIRDLRNLDARTWNGTSVTFEGTIEINGIKSDITGEIIDSRGYSGLLGHGPGGITTAVACQRACLNFVQKVKTIIDQKNQAK